MDGHGVPGLRFHTSIATTQKVIVGVVCGVFLMVAFGFLIPSVLVFSAIGGSVGGGLFTVVPILLTGAFLVVPTVIAVQTWRSAVWVDADNVLSVRSGLGGVSTVDLDALFEVRYFTERRRRRSKHGSRTVHVKVVEVRDTAGGEVKLSQNGWQHGEQLFAGIEQAARAVHAAIIDEAGVRRQGAGVPQRRSDPWAGTGAGAGIGYGQDHQQR